MTYQTILELACALEKRAFSGQHWTKEDWKCYSDIALISENDARNAYENALLDACAEVGKEYAHSLKDPEAENYDYVFDTAFNEVIGRASERTETYLEELSEERVNNAIDDFVRGWTEAGGVTADLDGDCPTPWALPWLYKDWDWDTELKGTTAYLRGRNYWDEVKDEVEATMKE